MHPANPFIFTCFGALAIRFGANSRFGLLGLVAQGLPVLDSDGWHNPCCKLRGAMAHPWFPSTTALESGWFYTRCIVYSSLCLP
jgi:hypothetical protein